jgi:tetratricopeptide (TPR) repeat protein
VETQAPERHFRSRGFEPLLLPVFLLMAYASVFAEKMLIYDEEKGIIFSDGKPEPAPPPHESPKGAESQKKERPAIIERHRPQPVSDGKTIDGSIQRGRHKDPPEVYFQSGLQYFKSNNFEDALKNFTHADSLDPQPRYVLWMGKTLRQQQKFDQLLFLMNRIVTTYPESDVADDALFEIAFCYQANDDYDKAINAYTKLSEQYPFGTSYSNGESFRELAHKQCQLMRADMVSSLKLLGFEGDDLESLYRAFQKSRGLAVSGLGDAQTVRAIKAAYDDSLSKETARSLRQARMDKYRSAALALLAVLFINVVVMIMLNRKISNRRRHVVSLNQVLSDLSRDKW